MRTKNYIPSTDAGGSVTDTRINIHVSIVAALGVAQTRSIENQQPNAISLAARQAEMVESDLTKCFLIGPTYLLILVSAQLRVSIQDGENDGPYQNPKKNLPSWSLILCEDDGGPLSKSKR